MIHADATPANTAVECKQARRKYICGYMYSSVGGIAGGRPRRNKPEETENQIPEPAAGGTGRPSPKGDAGPCLRSSHPPQAPCQSINPSGLCGQHPLQAAFTPGRAAFRRCRPGNSPLSQHASRRHGREKKNLQRQPPLSSCSVERWRAPLASRCGKGSLLGCFSATSNSHQRKKFAHDDEAGTLLEQGGTVC